MNILKSMLLAGVFTAFTTGAMATQDEKIAVQDWEPVFKAIISKGTENVTYDNLDKKDQAIIDAFANKYMGKTLALESKEQTNTFVQAFPWKKGDINGVLKSFVTAQALADPSKTVDFSNDEDYKLVSNFLKSTKFSKGPGKATQEESNKFYDEMNDLYRSAFAKFQAINALFDNFYGTDLANVEKDKIAETVKEVIRNRINTATKVNPKQQTPEQQKEETSSKAQQSFKGKFGRKK